MGSCDELETLLEEVMMLTYRALIVVVCIGVGYVISVQNTMAGFD